MKRLNLVPIHSKNVGISIIAYFTPLPAFYRAGDT